jgi:hypothetical protein
VGLACCNCCPVLLLSSRISVTKSKEELELSEFKRIQSAQNENSAVEIENRTKIAIAVTNRTLAIIDSGNIDDVERWNAVKEKL